MGTFGYNETIWVVSDECALRKTVSVAGDTCCVWCLTIRIVLQGLIIVVAVKKE